MTLIEILVAIVVLSVGLLGLAGLQLKGMQVNQGSVYRWQAVELAEDIADRMRADAANVYPTNNYAMTNSLPATPPNGMADWWGRVQALPSGSATIGAFVPSGAAPATGGSVTITISWLDSRAQGGAGVSASSAAYSAPSSYTTTLEF